MSVTVLLNFSMAYLPKFFQKPKVKEDHFFPENKRLNFLRLAPLAANFVIIDSIEVRVKEYKFGRVEP